VKGIEGHLLRFQHVIDRQRLRHHRFKEDLLASRLTSIRRAILATPFLASARILRRAAARFLSITELLARVTKIAMFGRKFLSRCKCIASWQMC
jgi:hypothetical protein